MADGRLNRRSFALAVGTAAMAGGALALVGPAFAKDPPGHQPNMSDSDAGVDTPNRPRGARRTSPTGVTDRDAGGNADRGGFGRGAPASPGCPNVTGRSDQDPGDLANHGRTGASDSDPTDRGGCGRGRLDPNAPFRPPVLRPGEPFRPPR